MPAPDPTANLAPAGDANQAAAALAARVACLEQQLSDINAKAAAVKDKANSAPTFALGGIFQLDYDNFSNVKLPAGETATDALGFRRLRLWAYGEAFNNVDYKFEMEFASTSRPKFKDDYINITQLPIIENIRIGHMKEPFGLEELTSDRFTTFMERSMLDEGYNIIPARNIGAEVFGTTENKRATYAAGVFLNEDNTEDPPGWIDNTTPNVPATTAPYVLGKPQGAGTMRLTWLPWYDEATEGRGLWHVGAAYSYRNDTGIYNPATGQSILTPNYNVKPEAYFGPYILGFTNLPAKDNQLASLETAVVYGPLSFQAEYFNDRIDDGTGVKPINFNGGYAYVSYFLTGENRVYNRDFGCFDRVRPFTNFFRVTTCDGTQSGWGAWEIGYRISCSDFVDGVPLAQHLVGMGRATDNTLGLNWYLNPNTRLMFNYVLTSFARVNANGAAPVDGYTMNTLEMRAAFDF